MKIIGIDPGGNGGIAVWDCEKNVVDAIYTAKKDYPTAKDMLDVLAKYNGGDCMCAMEKVQGLPKMGGGAMFTFGKNFGYLEMSLLANGIPTYEVTPQKWQKYYQLGTKSQCSSKVEWKNKLKYKAQQLFPNIKVTLDVADALLIMYYQLKQTKDVQD